MPEISIIVPVYNVERYIHKCIDSILEQTFTDFELILVNDGSPDNCGKICDAYAAEDTRIKVIHKKNGGLSDARNAGIDIARGEYIGFVDSDDYIKEDMYEMLYRNITEYHADISVCGIYHCYENKIVGTNKNSHCKCFTKKAIIEGILSGKVSTVSAGNKLYNARLFSNLRYPVGHLFEDAFLIVDILFKTTQVVVDASPKYYYVHRENSITTQKFTHRDYDIVLAYSKNLEIIKKHFPNLLDVAYYRFWWAHFYLLNRLALDTKQRRTTFKGVSNSVKERIRKDISNIVKNPYQSFFKKMAYALIAFSPEYYMNIYHWWFYHLRTLRK